MAQHLAQHTPQLARTELLHTAPPVLLSHPTYIAAIAILVLDIMSTILTRTFFRTRLQNTNLTMLRLETLNLWAWVCSNASVVPRLHQHVFAIVRPGEEGSEQLGKNCYHAPQLAFSPRTMTYCS